MPSPLLSTFRAGENRITSSTMAVFERIDLALVAELLEKAGEITGRLNAVTFENQVTTTGSVPDARISARFTWWFETKTERGAYQAEGHSRSQLRNHVLQLQIDTDAILFVLTPDAVQPPWLEDPDGVVDTLRQRIVWLSFKGIADAIDDVLGDNGRLVGEQTRFLLAELRALYESDGLLTNDDTVVVAARIAWDNYLAYSAYVCQPNRAFKGGLRRFGFYHAGQIEDLVPEILGWFPTIDFTAETAAAMGASLDPLDVRVSEVIRESLAIGARNEDEAYGVMLLSGPEDSRTVRLKAPIRNDTKASTGRSWAWTLGQRYTSLDRLTSGATLTSAL